MTGKDPKSLMAALEKATGTKQAHVVVGGGDGEIRARLGQAFESVGMGRLLKSAVRWHLADKTLEADPYHQPAHDRLKDAEEELHGAVEEVIAVARQVAS